MSNVPVICDYPLEITPSERAKRTMAKVALLIWACIFLAGFSAGVLIGGVLF